MCEIFLLVKAVFDKPIDAALAYVLSHLSKVEAASIWGNEEGTEFYFEPESLQYRTMRSSFPMGNYIKVGLLNPPRNVDATFEKIRYIYEAAADGRLLDVTLQKLKELYDTIKREIIEPITNFLDSQVKYIKTYVDNPYKIVGVFAGLLGGMWVNLATGVVNTADILLSLAEGFNPYIRDELEPILSTYKLEEGVEIIEEKIKGLTSYEDAYYLGKILGDIVR